MLAASHSAVTPAALIGSAHFLISLTTNALRYSIDRRSGATGSEPTVLSRSWTAGMSRTVTIASWSLRTMGAGVSRGKKAATHPVASKPASPCSSAVCKSGKAEDTEAEG
jgi:hypothetical protein